MSNYSPREPWTDRIERWGGVITQVRDFDPTRPKYEKLQRSLVFKPPGDDSLTDRLIKVMMWCDHYARLGIDGRQVPPEIAPYFRPITFQRIHPDDPVTRRASFPTLLSCNRCDGVQGLHGHDQATATDALFVDCAQWVISFAYSCDNPPPDPKVCECKALIAQELAIGWTTPVIVDSGWKSTQIGRCYYRYDRTIQFQSPVPNDQREQAKKFAMAMSNVGWAIGSWNASATVLTMTYTIDSSD